MAEELASRFDLPLWRFTNSGTESTMDAVHLMRAITGRDLIIKVEGCYHGHHDSVQVSVTPEADVIGPADRPVGATGSHARGLLRGLRRGGEGAQGPGTGEHA